MRQEDWTAAMDIMKERFGKDTVLALATTSAETPHVRMVNAYYEDGAFYVITDARSGKMAQLAQNPRVGVAGEWFTGQGEGKSLGWIGRTENKTVADKLRRAFSAWLDNGHSDLTDENTIILCIRLTSGVLLHHGKRYDLAFPE